MPKGVRVQVPPSPLSKHFLSFRKAALKIETFERDDHQKKIIAEFDADTLERFKRQAARKIATESRIPGFRPGKAPYDMVRRIRGDQAIQEEAINLLLDDAYPQVIKEAGIDAYGPGQLEEVLSLDPPSRIVAMSFCEPRS